MNKNADRIIEEVAAIKKMALSFLSLNILKI